MAALKMLFLAWTRGSFDLALVSSQRLWGPQFDGRGFKLRQVILLEFLFPLVACSAGGRVVGFAAL